MACIPIQLHTLVDMAFYTKLKPSGHMMSVNKNRHEGMEDSSKSTNDGSLAEPTTTTTTNNMNTTFGALTIDPDAFLDEDTKAIANEGRTVKGIGKCCGGKGQNTWVMLGERRKKEVSAITSQDNWVPILLPCAIDCCDSSGTYPGEKQPDNAGCMGSSGGLDLSDRKGNPPRDVLSGVSRADYMHLLWDMLKDKPLNDMCLLSSHDSLTYDLSCNLSTHDVLPGKVAWGGNKFLSHRTLHYLKNMGRAQVLSVRDQFETGVRFFDIRATLLKGEWYSVHSFTSMKPLVEYLKELAAVMGDHDHFVVVVTVSRHGTQNKPSGTDLDKLGKSNELWSLIVGSLGEHMMDHSKVDFLTDSLSTIVSGGKRLALFIDGWEAIGRGDRRAGETSVLNHVGLLQADIGQLKKDSEIIRDSFDKNCVSLDVKPQFCYMGLNSANSTGAIIKAAFEMGSFMERSMARRFKSNMDPKLSKLGVHPGTLMSYAQLSLYYVQYTLMKLITRIDNGEYISAASQCNPDRRIDA